MTDKKWLWLPIFFLLIAIAASGCARVRIDPYARPLEKTPPKAKIEPAEATGKKTPSLDESHKPLVEKAPEKMFQIEEETLPVPKPAKPDPRALASLELTEQGRMLLEQGRVDEAMTVFESAVNLSPENGRNYYYLAEAWLIKGDLRQAGEWNRLAELYLQGDPDWAKRVSSQKVKINGD